jgi:23S rRNA (cytosine1962-C5)-methyltransferase
MAPTVVVSRRGADRIRAGHPWVYQSDVVRADANAGDLVRVLNERERRLGWALWSTASQISLRIVETAGPPDQQLDDRALFAARIRAAIDYRQTLEIDASACRLVNAEADGLPGLIVDKYGDGTGDYLVLQTLCQGMDRRLRLIAELLLDLARPRGILARNDPKVRRLEGLDERVEVLAGEVPDEIEVREGAVTCHVDVRRGQKTGLFLDQRENHQAAARYARGRALDAFTYNGGFALQMASRCEHVLALDSSKPAIAATRRNAQRNSLANLEAREVNVFDELRELEVGGERFDIIVLDPPAFAKNRAAVTKARAGYKEINLRALKLLSPGGTLVSCSCSYHISEAEFAEIVYEAAVDAGVQVAVVEKRMQGRDHPVVLGVPETYYLKCFILRKLG